MMQPSAWTVPALETRVFLGAVVIGLVHAVDDAVLNRQPGVPAGQHLVALGIVTAIGVAAGSIFTRLRPGIRSGFAVVIGAVALTNGALHVVHVATAEVTTSDLTGVLAAAAGLVLIGLGFTIPVTHRGEGSSTRRGRWANRAIGVVVVAVLAQFFVIPVNVGLVQTHLYRRAVGNPPAESFRSVSFDSSDGLSLAGWYHPSKNRAAVVIANSAGGDRNGSIGHAELLASHGYGVLLYDARGTGASEGSPNGWGWDWKYDVLGALAFLRSQPDVDPGRLGGLGLSTGADVIIEVAATNRDLRVVVADGATGRSFADRLPGLVNASIAWPMFTAGQVFSGDAPGKPLRELVAQMAPTPLLLIAAGSIPGEIPLNQAYANAAGEQVELWALPEVTHTNAIDQVASEYERRVVEHLDTALLKGRNQP
jgi:dienelactone hydrolase